MINMLRKGIKFSIQRVYFPQSYFDSRHYGKRFNSIEKFKSLTFQLRAIYFHTFAVDLSVYVQHTHCDCVFTLEGPAHLARISKIMMRQKKRNVNAVNDDNVQS